MKITLNGALFETDAATLAELVEKKAIKKEGTAIACDGEIVPSSQWAEFNLQEGMTVDVFTLVAGG